MEKLDQKRILITGGLGFIGSNLAAKLHDLGANVTLVDSLVPQYGGNVYNVDALKSLMRVNVSDVRDPYSLRHLLINQDLLFNLAGQTSHVDSMEDPFTDLEINCKAQLSILEACREVNPTIRIVFASTRQVYGRPQYLPVDEKHPIRPVDVNGVNKVSGESFHLLYSDVYGIPTTVLRLTNTYGPRMRIKDARQTFVGIWIRHMLEGKPFEVWGGEQLRDFTFVDDCVDAMIRAAVCDSTIGKALNVGGGEVVSLRQFAELLLKAAGEGTYQIREFPQDRKKIDIGDFYSDASQLRQLTGWAPRTSLLDGLCATVEWFRPRLKQYVG